MRVQVKICGIKDVSAVDAVVTAGANYAGFVFFPTSPRHIPLEQAKTLAGHLPSTLSTVSVLVDPDDTLLQQVDALFKPHFIQLHGKESPERVRFIRSSYPDMKIIKAISVRSSDDVSTAASYTDCADMLLFDAKPTSTALPGGNGLSFDWALLKNRAFSLPWMLSGGLHPGNVREAISKTDASMVDVSSGVERSPGVKDPQLIDHFIRSSHSL